MSVLYCIPWVDYWGFDSFMKNKFTYIKTILFFYAHIILNMLNLTFLFETCGKTEIQFIQLREDKVCVYSE